MLAGCMARKILIKMIAPRFVKLRIFVKTINNIMYNIIYMMIILANHELQQVLCVVSKDKKGKQPNKMLFELQDSRP